MKPVSESSSHTTTPLELHRPVVLVGMMGCGKSAIGKRAATALGVQFVDMDKRIEEQEGMSISALFSTHGEAYFRKREHETLQACLREAPAVIATGGGAFIQPHNQELILKEAVCVWLKAPYEVLLERVSRRNTRPLLERGDKGAILRQLMDEREPVYAKAHLSVESSNGPHEHAVNRLIEALKHHGA